MGHGACVAVGLVFAYSLLEPCGAARYGPLIPGPVQEPRDSEGARAPGQAHLPRAAMLR